MIKEKNVSKFTYIKTKIFCFIDDFCIERQFINFRIIIELNRIPNYQENE